MSVPSKVYKGKDQRYVLLYILALSCQILPKPALSFFFKVFYFYLVLWTINANVISFTSDVKLVLKPAPFWASRSYSCRAIVWMDGKP